MLKRLIISREALLVGAIVLLLALISSLSTFEGKIVAEVAFACVFFIAASISVYKSSGDDRKADQTEANFMGWGLTAQDAKLLAPEIAVSASLRWTAAHAYQHTYFLGNTMRLCKVQCTGFFLIPRTRVVYCKSREVALGGLNEKWLDFFF